MPVKNSVDSQKFLDKYDSYLEAVENWQRWGTRIQELISDLQNNALYAEALLPDEISAISDILDSASQMSPPIVPPPKLFSAFANTLSNIS